MDERQWTLSSSTTLTRTSLTQMATIHHLKLRSLIDAYGDWEEKLKDKLRKSEICLCVGIVMKYANEDTYPKDDPMRTQSICSWPVQDGNSFVHTRSLRTNIQSVAIRQSTAESGKCSNSIFSITDCRKFLFSIFFISLSLYGNKGAILALGYCRRVLGLIH